MLHSIFVYGFALGDEVETTGDDYLVTRVVASGGQATLRIWLADATKFSEEEIIEALNRFGALLERSSTNLLAASLPMDQIDGALEYLDQMTDAGVEVERG